MTAVHCAYNVLDEVNAYVAPSAYGSPVPSATVFQPLNVKPARVKELAVNAADEADCCAVIDPAPPFASNVTVCPDCHLANNVVFEPRLQVTVEPAAKSVPLPSAAVFQPANECPVRAREPTAATVYDEPDVAESDDGALPDVLPLPL